MRCPISQSLSLFHSSSCLFSFLLIKCCTKVLKGPCMFKTAAKVNTAVLLIRFTRTFAFVINICKPCWTVWAIVSPTQGDLFLWGQVGTVSTQRARALSTSVCVILTIITWKILHVILRLSVSLSVFFYYYHDNSIFLLFRLPSYPV